MLIDMDVIGVYKQLVTVDSSRILWWRWYQNPSRIWLFRLPTMPLRALGMSHNHKRMKPLESQKNEVIEQGIDCFSWEKFTSIGRLDDEFPAKHKTHIWSIMYTSGTTVEPKGVILTNVAFMSEVLSVHKLLVLIDKPKKRRTSDFFLYHIFFYKIMETYCIYSGSSIRSSILSRKIDAFKTTVEEPIVLNYTNLEMGVVVVGEEAVDLTIPTWQPLERRQLLVTSKNERR